MVKIEKIVEHCQQLREFMVQQFIFEQCSSSIHNVSCATDCENCYASLCMTVVWATHMRPACYCIL